jgi:AraC family transcriptional regulator
VSRMFHNYGANGRWRDLNRRGHGASRKEALSEEGSEKPAQRKFKKGNMSTQRDQDPRVRAEPRFENGRALLIAGLREYAKTNAGVPAQWQRAMAYKIPKQVGQAAYGVCFDCYSGSEGFDYLVGVEVSDASGLPAELSQVRIPAQKYAVFPHREHVSQLWHTIDGAGKWLSQSGHEHKDTVPDAPDFFERYGEDFDPQTGRGGIEVWIPVKA